MTVIVKQYENENYYISLEITTRYNRSIYLVQVYEMTNGEPNGYPIKEISYPINEKQKALATYRRYIKKYC